MLNKKLVMLLIIVVSLLAVSTASAAENATDIATADADTIENELQANSNDNGEINILKLSDNEDIVSEPDNGTFMDLQTKIDAAGDGGIVNLENNYSYDDTFSSNGITIKNPITINGNGFEINGAGQSRIFCIDASNNVTLNDITFVKGYSSLGGAIIFNGDASGIVINNCRFIDNVASENGGAIYANGTFMNNVISNSEFSSNIASKNGGAIYILNNCNGSLFENITFSNNTANNADGGAINFHAQLLNTTFNNLMFTDNRAANGGGAINTDNNINNYNSYANSTFINNAANKGGALNGYGYSNYNSFESCEFKNNSAINSGGAIYYARNIESNTFKYCVFADNSAKANGGAIYSYRNSNRNRYTNIVFANNTAANNGGAIYNRGYSDSEVYSNTIFINNSATSVDGGAINVYANLAGVTFDNVTFVDNRAAGNGGAINVDDDAKYVIFNDTRFINNAAKRGGALSFIDSKRNSWLNTIFADNTAVVSGSAINVFRTMLEDKIYASYFISNRADGALIDLTNVTDSNFEAIFINNTGESILLMNHVNDTIICNNLFLDNEVNSTIILISGNNVNVNRNIFLNNATAQEIIGKGVNADNNWFGHNTTNYNTRPNLPDDINYDTWLFLNATANPSRIYVYGSSDIMFLLYAYNSTSNETCEFDLMNNVYLDITVAGGDVDTDFADLGEHIGFISLNSGTANVTAAIGSAKYTISIVIDKLATELISDRLVTVYNADKYLVITLKDNLGNPIAGASITVDLNGVKKKTTDANGQVKLSTSTLVPNTYDVSIKFAGGQNYVNSSKTTQVVVNKGSTKIIARSIATFYNKGYLVATLKDTNNNVIRGVKLTIRVCGVTYTLKTNSLGQIKWQIPAKLTPKIYTAALKFAGDSKYKASPIKYVKLNVRKDASKILATNKIYKVDAAKKVTAILKDSKNRVIKGKYVTFRVNGVNYKVKTNEKGVATATVNINKVGSYGTFVTFAGDSCYKKFSKLITVTVK